MTGMREKLEGAINRLAGAKWFVALYLLLAAVSMILLACIQPFGDPPDEINRFKVVYYIATHHALPTGFEQEVILGGYGGSYAFQPILPYMIMGGIIAICMNFSTDAYTLIFIARMVNVVFGVIMAYYVWKIAKQLWEDVIIQWLFTLMIVFLPMNLFMHSYVNTDSMALLSTAMIVYSMLTGEADDYGKKTCIRMGIGVVLCAMSYYNAYGIVLSAMVFFVYHFARKKDWRALCIKGSWIAAIVLLGAGWWFVRNGILYEGDLLGMEARRRCAMETALPEYNPLTRFTFYGAGLPITAVFQEKQYAWVTFESMIAMFGPMNIPTHGLIYVYYKWIAIVAAIGMVLPIPKKQPHYFGQLASQPTGKERGMLYAPRLVFGLTLLLDCLITMGLHLYYSYTWEYQPQGRYLLPMLVSAGYLLTMGIWKLGELCKQFPEKKGKEGMQWVRLMLLLLLLAFVMATYAYTLFIRVLPVYGEENCLTVLKGIPFGELVHLFFGR